MMKVSIIVPCYKRIDQTMKTLSLISASELSSDLSLELIVSDSSSDDLLQNSLKQNFGSKVLYTKPEQSGISSGKNQGARIATGDILIFCDSDIEIESDTIAKTIEYLKNNKYASAVSGQVFWKEGKADGKVDRPRVEDRIYEFENYKAIEVIYSRYIATYKDIFWKVGGYDEDVFNMRGEGSDLSTRYWRMGFPLFYDHDIAVHHVHNAPDSIALRIKHPEWGIAKDLLLLAYKYDMLDGEYSNFANTVAANFNPFGDEGYYKIVQGIANNLDFIAKSKDILDQKREEMKPEYDFKFLEVFSDIKKLTKCLEESENKIEESRRKAFINE